MPDDIIYKPGTTTPDIDAMMAREAAKREARDKQMAADLEASLQRNPYTRTNIPSGGASVTRPMPISTGQYQTVQQTTNDAAVKSKEPEKLWVHDQVHQDLNAKAVQQVPKESAAGLGGSHYQQFWSNFDRYKRVFLIDNCEYSGYVFVTRPKLNLVDSSLLMDRNMVALLTDDPTHPLFAVRCLLDTAFMKNIHNFDKLISGPFAPLAYSPFINPLCNAMIGMSGWPDMNIQTHTSEGGFHSEAQQIPIGYDRLNRTYEFTLEFRDPMGAPITKMLEFYLLAIANLAKGIQLPYIEDLIARRMCFTVSFYRFLVDPSHNYITRFSKATGCFPTALRQGANFDMAEGEHFQKNASRQTTRWTVSKVEYNDYIIINEFNRLMRRYNPVIGDPAKPGTNEGISATNTWSRSKNFAASNYEGYPYIVKTDNGWRFDWRITSIGKKK